MFLNCWLASKLRSIETFMLCSNAECFHQHVSSVLDSSGIGNNSVDLSHKQANRVNIDINLNGTFHNFPFYLLLIGFIFICLIYYHSYANLNQFGNFRLFRLLFKNLK
ncbi:hypothetical protein D917_03013 [Trichinella nativa]|uniref:Uncharacterized protein n=1 Tax=Trichinella nativa TaxID=6335 RepID=A0A1Y3EB47_9BILA|nr:hypothetical protein D917_03013 [Trichinella nativa]